MPREVKTSSTSLSPGAQEGPGSQEGPGIQEGPARESLEGPGSPRRKLQASSGLLWPFWPSLGFMGFLGYDRFFPGFLFKEKLCKNLHQPSIKFQNFFKDFIPSLKCVPFNDSFSFYIFHIENDKLFHL